LVAVAPRGRKRKAIPPASNDEGESTAAVDQSPVKDENVNQETSNGTNDNDIVEKKEKKPKKQLAEGMKTGTYDAEEEAKFLEGLELFGREWTKVWHRDGCIKGYKGRRKKMYHDARVHQIVLFLPCVVLPRFFANGLHHLACSPYRDSGS
jgi:hypothetical protein